MKIELALITYNRLEYTRLVLPTILADESTDFSLVIWDNASTDGTVDYLKRLPPCPRISEIVYSANNIGQIRAVNEIWNMSKADLLGKLDNDCLLTPGWTRALAKAHEDIAELGSVACWHYPVEEFDEVAARRVGKIQTFGSHQILRHPWTCGTGLLIKRETYQRFGPMEGKSTTPYWLRLAAEGYVNGFYYPLIPQEHMDDPASKHCLYRDDEGLQALSGTSEVLRQNRITNMDQRWSHRRMILANLNSGAWEAKYYMGWRRKLRNIRRRLGV